MLNKVSVCNVEIIERRKRWRDRRAGSDRRNEARLKWQVSDSRSDTPRRVGDLSGVLTEGTVWWRSDKHSPNK